MDKLFLSVLNMSLTASVVIAAVVAARFVLRRVKAPRIVAYGLWAVVFFRLLCPMALEGVLSLMPINPAPIPVNLSQMEHADVISSVNSGTAIVDGAIETALTYARTSVIGHPYRPMTNAVSNLWLAGASAMLIYAIVSYLLLKRKLRFATKREDGVFETDRIPSPFVLGFARPKIYLPVGHTDADLEYILCHERTHMKRRDDLIKLLAYFALSIHWFNPLVWLAYFLLSADMEMSCDERVLRDLGGEVKTSYSTALLNFATGRRLVGFSPLAFGEGGVKERVKNVLNFKKRSRGTIVAAVLLAVVLSVGFAVNRANPGRTDRDLSNFSVYGLTLGQPIDETVLASLTPLENYASDEFEYNFRGADGIVHYSPDAETGVVRKLYYDVLENGYRTNLLSSAVWTSIEQVAAHYGEGKRGWYDRAEGIRSMEYTQKQEGFSATVKWIYRNDNHQILCVYAESSLPYPKPYDVSLLAALRIPYVGDNSAVGNIVGALPPLGLRHTQKFFSIGDDYGTSKAPYTLTVYYEQDGQIQDDYAITPRNATLLFALIDNLEEVSYAIRTSPSGDTLDKSAYTRATYTRAELDKYLATVGLTWKNFHDDWNTSVEKAFALIGDGFLDATKPTSITATD
jgi:beta-lactamase regulating signal transducer with metallopeptidase domain